MFNSGISAGKSIELDLREDHIFLANFVAISFYLGRRDYWRFGSY